MDGDLDLLSLLPDEDLMFVLLPGDRLLSLLVGLALHDPLLSNLPLGDLYLVLEALLVLEARLVLEACLVFEALLVLDNLLVLDSDLLRLRVEGVLYLLLL